MAQVFKWLARIWAVLYVVALFLFLVGTFGWFGSETGPLAGVFLVPLGLPWNRFVDLFPELLWPWLAAATPMLNIAIFLGLSRMLERR